MPGKTNEVADCLSRWAYPASKALFDVSKHGSWQDKVEVEEFERQEKLEERGCAVVTRRGTNTAQDEEETSPQGTTSENIGNHGTSVSSPPMVTTTETNNIPKTGATAPTHTMHSSHPSQVESPILNSHDSSEGQEKNLGSAHEDQQGEGHLEGTNTLGNRIPELSVDESTSSVGLASPNVDRGTPGQLSVTMADGVGEPRSQAEDGQSPLDTSTPPLVSVDNVSWEEAYKKCSGWSSVWKQVQDSQSDRNVPWPSGIQVHDGRLYKDQKLLVPISLQKSFIKQHHEFLGHVGFERLWSHISHRFGWSNDIEAKKMAEKVMKECEACQACQPPLSLKARIRPFPIPPFVMSHVAIDLFKLPPVEFEGEKFDTLIVCVDRHSGWIVAVPTL